jgi:putative transcriptional regulator
MASFNEIIEIRKKSGLSQRKFSELLNIPLRTWESWGRGLRVPPNYVVDLIAYRLKDEFKAQKAEP